MLTFCLLIFGLEAGVGKTLFSYKITFISSFWSPIIWSKFYVIKKDKNYLINPSYIGGGADSAPPLIDFWFFLLNGYCHLHETLCKFLSYISEDSYTLIWSKKIVLGALRGLFSKIVILKIAIFGGVFMKQKLLKIKSIQVDDLFFLI